MKAWAYLRTSTDDKGQDPERQLDRIRPFCQASQIELAGFTTDEGTSGLKKGPLERRKFMFAVDEAKDKGCKYLVVETGDRFTRQDPARYFVDAYRLLSEHGLRLLVSDESMESQNSRLSPVITAIKAMAANEWIENHSAKVRTGMAKKKCKLPVPHVKGPSCTGYHPGKEPKHFSNQEFKLIWESRHPKPVLGWRPLAHQINRARGCFTLTDEEKRRRLMMSSVLVRRAFEKMECAHLMGFPAHPLIKAGSGENQTRPTTPPKEYILNRGGSIHGDYGPDPTPQGSRLQLDRILQVQEREARKPDAVGVGVQQPQNPVPLVRQPIPSGDDLDGSLPARPQGQDLQAGAEATTTLPQRRVEVSDVRSGPQ